MDNFSGSYDGSIEDRVERRRSNNKRNERQTSIKPALKNRNSGELKRAGESRGYQNRSFEEEPNRHRTRTPPPPPSFVPPPPPENRPPSASKKYNPPGQGKLLSFTIYMDRLLRRLYILHVILLYNPRNL